MFERVLNTPVMDLRYGQRKSLSYSKPHQKVFQIIFPVDMVVLVVLFQLLWRSSTPLCLHYSFNSFWQWNFVLGFWDLGSIYENNHLRKKCLNTLFQIRSGNEILTWSKETICPFDVISRWGGTRELYYWCKFALGLDSGKQFKNDQLLDKGIWNRDPTEIIWFFLNPRTYTKTLVLKAIYLKLRRKFPNFWQL